MEITYNNPQDHPIQFLALTNQSPYLAVGDGAYGDRRRSIWVINHHLHSLLVLPCRTVCTAISAAAPCAVRTTAGRLLLPPQPSVADTPWLSFHDARLPPASLHSAPHGPLPQCPPSPKKEPEAQAPRAPSSVAAIGEAFSGMGMAYGAGGDRARSGTTAGVGGGRGRQRRRRPSRRRS
jgi:hypothetical protein